ncbi:MAG: TIGR02221 family CRISPR-associated protein [Chromatiaceae bacterium]
MTIQISFLGKSQIDSKTGYRSARYGFPDGQVVETAFFGLALAGKLNPSELVLLGTSGSMWDTLVENQAPGDGLEQHRLELIDAVRADAVTDAHLDPLGHLVAARAGCPVTLRVIPYGRTPEEQTGILRVMAEAVSGRSTPNVVLDVTHGLRHLPMLALVVAFYLERVLRVDVAEIYYGALEMTRDGTTPVLSLKGLLDVMDWVLALAGFDHDGDYGPLVPLLERAGAPADKVGHLRRAAFAERVFNHELARQNVLPLRDLLQAGLPGMAALFTEPLARRLEWAENAAAPERLAAIARERLSHGDYVRAAIAGTSGFLAGMARPGERLSDYDTFERMEREFRAGQRGDPSLAPDYEALKRLRNALAHGTPPRDEDSRRTLADETRLRQALGALIGRLCPR